VQRLYLQVTLAPPGEAPAWVREKWVGLTLPLAQASSRAITVRSAGVLTGPRTYLTGLLAWISGRLHLAEGYLVDDAPAALQVLESAHPEAAAWWRKHTPHIYQSNRKFLFHKGSGIVVEQNH
jgi:hypothetical protein